MLSVKSSTNTESFIEIGDNFCTLWLRSHGIISITISSLDWQSLWINVFDCLWKKKQMNSSIDHGKSSAVTDISKILKLMHVFNTFWSIRTKWSNGLIGYLYLRYDENKTATWMCRNSCQKYSTIGHNEKTWKIFHGFVKSDNK
jgi:hypothetical protein